MLKQKHKSGPLGIVATATFAFLVAAATLFATQPVAADTFTVTSKSLIGPGSFLEAIEMANNNPGPDIIEFTDNLQVDDNFSGVFGNKNTWMVEVTESLVIDGKGGALNGRQDWVNTDGIQSKLHCPDQHQFNDMIMAYMQNWLYIGELNKDNSDIEVTVKNLTIKQFNSVAKVNQNASLTFENFKAYDTWNVWGCIALGAIGVDEGGSLTIRDSEFYRLETWEDPEHYATAIIGIDAGDLIIEGSLFSELSHRDQFAIYWIGEAGSKVNIVSSRFRESGGIRIDGEVSETNIVNSIWVTDYAAYTPKFADRIVNMASGDMNIIASSLRWNTNHCQVGLLGNTCEDYNIENLIESGGSGKINFKQSVVGFTYEQGSGPGGYFNTLGSLGAGGFTADQYTWIEPTDKQDAGALRAITGQGSLRTDDHSFVFPYIPLGVEDYDSYMVTPASPGQLIDIIPDAGVGEANALINPIDGSFIEFDAIGHPRVDDATGQRDIGALQVGGGGPPILSLVGTGDGSVDLSWSVPVNPNCSSPVLLYVIRYYPTGSPSSLATSTVNPPATSATVPSLTNGTEYTFEIKAVFNCSGITETPYSSNVTATPYGVLGTPDVTAVAGNKEVALLWTLPGLGERTFESYNIMWRIAGTTDYTDALALYNPGTTTTTITGLKNGTSYEFAVTVKASGDVSEQGTATATPHGDIGDVDRSPDESLFATKWANKPRYWEREGYGDTCEKFEVGDDFGSVWEIVDYPSALILKSDLTNDVWEDPDPGYYGTASAKYISNVIVCYDNP